MREAGLLRIVAVVDPVASGLPGAAYTSEAFLAIENQRSFSESWVFAGFAHELARIGDVTPVSAGGGRCSSYAVRGFQEHVVSALE